MDVLSTGVKRLFCVVCHIPFCVFDPTQFQHLTHILVCFLQYTSYKIPCAVGSSYSLSFTDIMGFEQNENNGISVEDMVLALKGHIPEGYTVQSFKFCFCITLVKYVSHPPLVHLNHSQVFCMRFLFTSNTPFIVHKRLCDFFLSSLILHNR